MILRIFRYDPATGTPRYDDFEIDPDPGMTVLAALFAVQEQYDDSLAFRYSCRGAVCGTCAVLVNKVPRLACRTQVQALLDGTDEMTLVPSPGSAETHPFDPAREILIEPLPHLPVIRDLVVDWDEFFEKYRALGPVFRPKDSPPENERLMEPGAVHALEAYTNCILCAACYGACPVDGKDPAYSGPAALAKLYRFHSDPREARDGSRLAAADSPEGWWACEFHTNCRRVCPKGVPPDIAIGKARQELQRGGRKPSGPGRP
ncbi:MAG: succinate dehydrogenase/fumarate reductase iron-sulfur subunit [Methanomicrobiaceae archaeon]|nr:succinate dehydrogenase/fumarate reductase iron-sulfur subunit [Methanomicrobiaceae archaeon]